MEINRAEQIGVLFNPIEINEKEGIPMGRKKLVCIFLVCLAMIGSFCIPAGAVKNATQETSIVMLATGKFDVEVPADTIVKASSSFPLESGETVTVNASYSPRSADVEFGLIDPDGLFHPVSAAEGSFNKTFVVGQKGRYILAIRNNSSSAVSVSGFVNY